MKRVSFLLISLMVFFSLFGQKVHVVKKGDTLWDLSGYYYNNPFIWRNIYNANIDKIKDPHWIYPGQEFIIPDVPADNTSASEETTYQTSDVEDVVAEKEVSEKEITYTKVKEDDLMGAIKTIREDIKKIERTKNIKISNSIEYAVAKKLAFRAGYIIDVNPKIGSISGLYKDSYVMVTNEKIYLKLDTVDESFKGKEFIIFKYNNKVKDNESGAYLGKHVNIIGCVKIDGFDNNLAYGTITRSFDEISKGDMIGFMKEPFIPVNSTYLRESEDIRASLIGTENPKGRINEYTIVFVNAGKDKKINSGDVFTIIRKNKTGEYYAAGALQVLVPYENYSTAAVLSIKGNLDIKPYEELKLSYRNKTAYILNKYNELSSIAGADIQYLKTEETKVETVTEEPVITEVEQSNVTTTEEPVKTVETTVTTTEETVVTKTETVTEEPLPVVEEQAAPVVVEQTNTTVPPVVEEETVKQDNTGFIIEEEQKDTANDTNKIIGEEEIIIIEEQ